MDVLYFIDMGAPEEKNILTRQTVQQIHLKKTIKGLQFLMFMCQEWQTCSSRM